MFYSIWIHCGIWCDVGIQLPSFLWVSSCAGIVHWKDWARGWIPWPLWPCTSASLLVKWTKQFFLYRISTHMLYLVVSKNDILESGHFSKTSERNCDIHALWLKKSFLLWLINISFHCQMCNCSLFAVAYSLKKLCFYLWHEVCEVVNDSIQGWHGMKTETYRR